MDVIAPILYTKDKNAAKSGRWRISERILQIYILAVQMIRTALTQ
jgi:uncharacterized membrane protein YsdA (DUF1294 family)